MRFTTRSVTVAVLASLASIASAPAGPDVVFVFRCGRRCFLNVGFVHHFLCSIFFALQRKFVAPLRAQTAIRKHYLCQSGTHVSGSDKASIFRPGFI